MMSMAKMEAICKVFNLNKVVCKEMFQSNNVIKVIIKMKTMETIGGEHEPSDGRRNYNNGRWGYHQGGRDDHQPKWGHQPSVGTRLEGRGGGEGICIGFCVGFGNGRGGGGGG